MDRRTFLAGAAGVALVPGFGDTAQGQENALRSMVEASRSEKSLLVYSGLNSQVWQDILRPFRSRYPWISVETLELGSSEITERYIAERSSNTRTADFIAHTPDGWLSLQERGEILPHISPEGGNFPAGGNPFPGIYTFACDPLLVIWNKAILPPDQVPISFSDMVSKITSNPNLFRNRITTYSAVTGSYGYGINYAFVRHHGEKAWDWFKAIGPLTRVERGSGPMMEKVTSGEYLLSFFCAPTTVFESLRDPARAKLIGVSFIRDGNPMMLRAVAAMKAGRSPNSAKLLLETMLSREGQVACATAGVTPFRTDVSPGDVGGRNTYSSVAKEIGAQNIALVDYDPGLAIGYKDFIARWRAAYNIT